MNDTQNTMSSAPQQPQALTLTQAIASKSPSLGEYLERKGNGEDIGWVPTRERIKQEVSTKLARLASHIVKK